VRKGGCVRNVNRVDGTVGGSVVQAAAIYGGVHISGPRPEVPRQLAPPPSTFVGRATELAALDTATGDPVVVLTGPGGVGKTALARCWAHAVRDRFPDGQLSVDLNGFSAQAAADPGDALGHLLRALGTPPERVPATLDEQAARYRSLTAGRALLVMLDNAFSVAQVRPLLPGAGPSLVLVTSRQRLAGLAAEGGAVVEVRPLPVGDAVTLLERVLGPTRVDRGSESAAAIVRACDGLPLALIVVAARMAMRPKLTLARLAEQLEDEADRLRALRTPEGLSVLGSLDLSYRGMAPAASRVYRRLAALPGREYGSGAIAAMAGSAKCGDEAVDVLIQANLLEEIAPDRFRQHDLLFLHARQCFVVDEAEAAQAWRAGLEWYLAAASVADRVLTPYRRRLPYDFAAVPVALPVLADRDAALLWLDDQRLSLLVAGRTALEHGWDELAWHLCDVLWPLLLYRHYRDRIAVDERGVTAALRWGNRWAEADMRKRLGGAYAEDRRFVQAEEQFDLAAAGYREVHDPIGRTDVEELIASLYRRSGREREAITLYRRTLAANRAIGNPRRIALTLMRLGAVMTDIGGHTEAIGYLEEARGVFARLTDVDVDPYNGQRCEIALARAYLARGDLAEAAETAARGAAGMRLLGSTFDEARAVEVLAWVARGLGDIQGARRHWADALEIYEELESPRADAVRADLCDPGVVDGDGGDVQ
jgi:tetratricopeptide (TPR) repeat protein